MTPDATPISNPPSSVPVQAADAADDDGDEARHQQAGAHGRLEAELAGREHAAEAGEKDADREIERAQHADIDAERRDRLEVERAGADADAEARVAQQHEEQRHGDQPPSPP